MRARISRGSARGRLLRGTLGTGMLRLLSAGLGFLATILLARRLGVGEYGQYAFALSWVWLLGVLGLAGLDRLLIRFVAAFGTQQAWGELGGLLRWAGGAGLSVSLALAALAAILPPAPLVWLLAPLLVLMRLPQAALRGLNRVVPSQIPETLVQPLALIAGIMAAGWCAGGHLTALQALGLYAFATLVAVVVAFGLLLRMLPAEAKAAPPTYQSRLWMAGALPLLLVSGLDIVNSQMDILMLGSMAGTRAVSLYSAADRGAGLVAFPLTAANASLAPLFAGLYAAGERDRLQRLVTKSARAILLCSTLLAVVLVVGGTWFLRFFGPGFLPAREALLILSAGQWVNAAAGTVASLLLMTGHAREAAIGLSVSVIVHFLLDLALIPRWGANGAALAAAGSLALWNVLLAGFVWRRLGLYSTAFGPC